MVIHVDYHNTNYTVDLSLGSDISISLDSDIPGPNCFYAPFFEATPLQAGEFIGDTRKGAPVNFYNVKINPHGNGTHTECVGHIAMERVSILDVLTQSHFVADLISVFPTKDDDGDRRITRATLIEHVPYDVVGEAIIIRTLPNPSEKMRMHYSGTNPPYMDGDAIAYLVERGYKHLLIDLPSIDREEDGGQLAGHKIFWSYPQILDTVKTITEMIFVPDSISDGCYFINFQIAPFKLDASPSRIMIYPMTKQ